MTVIITKKQPKQKQQETCHLTRCKKRRERQTKEHDLLVAQQRRLEEEAHKRRTLNLWGG